MENMSWRGVAAVLVSATCFGGTSILIKKAYTYGLTPVQVMFLQSWIASALLLAYNLAFNRSMFVIDPKTLGVLALQGLVGSLGTSLLYSYSLLYLPVSVAILLLYLYPGLVMGASAVFWHRRVSGREAGALLLTLMGTALASGIFSGIGPVAKTGILLGIGSALAYTVFNVVGELALADESPLRVMSFAQWFSSLGLLVYLREQALALPWQLASTWTIGLALATIASIAPFYLLLVGIKYLGADKAAILSTFELPMTFVLAALLLAEFPHWHEWLGGSLVLAGIVILNWRGKRVSLLE